MHRSLWTILALLPTACGGSVAADDAATAPLTCSARGRGLTIYVENLNELPLAAEGSVTAAVRTVSAGVVELDACHPAADCVPSLIRVSLEGKGVDLAPIVPVGGFVKLDWERVATNWVGDSWRVVVSSVATWGGMANPAGTGDALLFAANFRRPDPLPAAPFVVAKAPLDCARTSGESSCEYERAYAYDVTAGGLPTRKVGMGQRAEVGNLVFENFEAWDSKCTDDYWHWSWLATRKAL